MRRKIRKPYSEMSKTEKLAEARGAIARLESTLNAGQNRYGVYGDNVRRAIKGWQTAITELSA